jgi:hypothetical protein
LKAKAPKAKAITRRDGYILCKALAFAIEGLGATRLPQLSDISDMKRILGFMLSVEVTETDVGTELAPNWYQDQALYELGALFDHPDPKAKARALARVKEYSKAIKKALAFSDARIRRENSEAMAKEGKEAA